MNRRLLAAAWCGTAIVHLALPGLVLAAGLGLGALAAAWAVRGRLDAVSLALIGACALTATGTGTGVILWRRGVRALRAATSPPPPTIHPGA